MILIGCIIKYDDKYYRQIFLEETSHNKQAQRKALKKYKGRVNVSCMVS